MIQRIQTIYLLLAAILMSLACFLPLTQPIVVDEVGELVPRAFGVSSGVDIKTPHMGILMVLCAMLPFVNIFLFKRRMLQFRLCFVEIVLLIGAQIYIVYYLFRYKALLEFGADSTIGFTLVDVFPLVSIILVWLASRAILKDELLVKSLDRIR